jgi:hypothetical protein
MSHHPVSPRHTTLHGTTASPSHPCCHDVVLEHTFPCRSPYQHCPQIVGLCSAVWSSTDPWFIASSGPQRNGPSSTAHLQPTETLHATCSSLSRPKKKSWFIDHIDWCIVSKCVCRRSLRTSNVKWVFLARCHARGIAYVCSPVLLWRCRLRVHRLGCMSIGVHMQGKGVWQRSGRRDLFRTRG